MYSPLWPPHFLMQPCLYCIGLFIILEMRSRVISEVWSSPGVPGPGPTPCRAGRDAGDVSQQIIHNDDKFLTWTSARSLKIFQKNQTIHSLQMIKWVKVKIAVLCACLYHIMLVSLGFVTCFCTPKHHPEKNTYRCSRLVTCRLALIKIIL